MVLKVSWCFMTWHTPKPLAAPDGTTLIFHIGCGVPLHPGETPLNCSNGTTPVAPPTPPLGGRLGRCD